MFLYLSFCKMWVDNIKHNEETELNERCFENGK